MITHKAGFDKANRRARRIVVENVIDLVGTPKRYALKFDIWFCSVRTNAINFAGNYSHPKVLLGLNLIHSRTAVEFASQPMMCCLSFRSKDIDKLFFLARTSIIPFTTVEFGE